MVMPIPDGQDWTLLPAHSTEFEHALEIAVRPDARITAAIQQLQGIKLNPPDAYLPSLAWEYGLLPIVPYLPDLRTAIAEGLLWQKERGTEWAIRRALSWLAMPVAAYEEAGPGCHWREIQLDPGLIPNEDQITAIRTLTRMSARAVTVLRRLYHGYDVRRVVLDQNNRLDHHLLDNDSGVLTDGLWRSFGRERQQALNSEQQQTVARLVHRIQVATATYPDRWLLDVTPVFDELELRMPPVVRGRLRIGQAVYSGRVRQHQHSRLSFAALVLDETPYLDTINAVLDPCRLVAGESFVLDEQRLDGQKAGQWQPVDRYIERLTQGQTDNPYSPQVGGCLRSRHVIRVHTGEHHRWPVLDEYAPDPMAPAVRQRWHSRRVRFNAYAWPFSWLQQPWATNHHRVSQAQGSTRIGQVICLSDYRAQRSQQRTRSKAIHNSFSTSSETARQRRHARYSTQGGAYWPPVRWRNARVSWAEAGSSVSGVLYARTG